MISLLYHPLVNSLLISRLEVRFLYGLPYSKKRFPRISWKPFFHSSLADVESFATRCTVKICKVVISNKEFQNLIYTTQRYHNGMAKFTEIAVDLLSKMIKYSGALK